jgi:LacI family transcriptional regulator
MTSADRPRRILIGFRVVEALSQVLQGISGYIREHGRRWEIRCVDAEEFSRLVQRQALDGAITTIPASRADLLAEVTAAGVPAVNMLHDCHAEIPSVLTDEAEIGRAAAEYFVARGFRNFAYLGFDSAWSRGREKGFTTALAEAGHRYHVCECWADVTSYRFLDTPHAAPMVQAWMASLPKPVAVLACSDSVASTAMGNWVSAGVRVPEEVAVMGVGNFVSTCELAPVPLSSVAMDFPRMAYEAARVLDGVIQGSRPQQPSLLPPAGIVSRRSTNAFSFEDENVSAAMAMIHERAAEGLTLKELLRHVPVSRKWLGVRFKQLVGRTASEEIRRLRLERVRDLLLNTDLSVQQIAARCGFSRPENLTRFFRDGYGVPPETYRARSKQKAW